MNKEKLISLVGEYQNKIDWYIMLLKDFCKDNSKHELKEVFACIHDIDVTKKEIARELDLKDKEINKKPSIHDSVSKVQFTEITSYKKDQVKAIEKETQNYIL